MAYWSVIQPELVMEHTRDGVVMTMLILGVCAPLIVLLDAFSVITLAVSLYG